MVLGCFGSGEGRMGRRPDRLGEPARVGQLLTRRRHVQHADAVRPREGQDLGPGPASPLHTTGRQL